MKLNKSVKNVFAILIFTVAAVGFFACGDDNSLEELRNNELAELDTYIKANYPNVKPKSSGLYYIEVKKGSGDSINIDDVVQIYYAIWDIDSTLKYQTSGYIDGYRFEQEEFKVKPANTLSPEYAEHLLQTPGLHEAITYMQPGTVANVVLNSGLAFGQNGLMNNYIQISGFTSILVQVEVYKVYPAK